MSNFVPEVHDIAKLVRRDIDVPLTEGNALKAHDREGKGFRNLDWQRLGETEPDNATWAGVIYHMDQQSAWVRDLALSPEIPVSESDRARLFLLVLADHLAATAGRALKEGGSGESAQVYRLWRPRYADELRANPEPIGDAEALRRMVRWMKTDPADDQTFQEQYRASLLCRGEDETIPRNVTSLASHSILTGKFYRVLARYATVDAQPLQLVWSSQPVSTTAEAERLWQARLVRASVHFHQQPVRPSDLGIFDRLNEAHQAFAQAFPDHLLFGASDDLWLFAPPESLFSIKELFKPYTERGLYVTAQVQEATLLQLGVWKSSEGTLQSIDVLEKEGTALANRLAELTAQLGQVEKEIRENRERLGRVTSNASRQPLIERDRALLHRQRLLRADQKKLEEGMPSALREIEQNIEELKNRTTQGSTLDQSFYPTSLLDSFPPPLCEICQVRQGQPIQFGARIDYLCRECAEIRKGGFSQRQLGDQLEREAGEGEGERAISRARYLWLRIALDSAQLEPRVAGLFERYVDEKVADALKRWPLKSNLRLPSLLRDHAEDYASLLVRFHSGLSTSAAGTTRLCSNVWVMPVESGEPVRNVLRLYLDTLRAFFPCFFDPGSAQPNVVLSGSVAPATFPFYEHWRYLQNPNGPVNLRWVGRAQLEVGLKTAGELLDRVRPGEGGQRAFLHRVAAIERETKSRFMLQAAFMDEESRAARSPDRPLLPAVQLYMSGVASAEQILAFHKLTDWR